MSAAAGALLAAWGVSGPAVAGDVDGGLSPPLVQGPAASARVERLHVLHDAEARAVRRQMVAVHDPHPELGLDFTWLPEAGNMPGVDPQTGLAEGPGRLSWRLAGAPDYDARALHHSYSGTLRAGRFDGEGVLRYRDGTVIRGTWADGRLHGRAEIRDTAGNRFEGSFRDGRAEGQGRWVSAAGWVYEGGFAAGLPHGPGQIIRPGGIAYAVLHDAGRKTGSERPVLMADPLVGGLLPAQGGAQADRVTLAVSTDARIVQEQEYMVPYVHWSGPDQIAVYPGDNDMVALWNGDAPIDDLWYMSNENAGWDDSFAALRVDLSTSDGSRVELREVALEVARSAPYLKPMLGRREHLGCLGLRPTFNFRNIGWGPVENPRARIRFVDAEEYYMRERGDMTMPGTSWVPVQVDPFDIGTDVNLRAALHALGVDLAALERSHFDCSAFRDGEACLPAIRRAASFGELAPFLSVSQVFYTDGDFRNNTYIPPEGAFLFSALAQGELEYEWTDFAGQRVSAREYFSVPVSLAVSERRDAMMAEYGAGGAYPVAAPDFLDVDLPFDAADYRVAIRPRGNPNVNRFAALYRLYSARSSTHDFTAVAYFGDGSTRRSPPVTLYFLNPRRERFVSTADPAKCLMPPLVRYFDFGDEDFQ